MKRMAFSRRILIAALALQCPGIPPILFLFLSTLFFGCRPRVWNSPRDLAECEQDWPGRRHDHNKRRGIRHRRIQSV